MQSGWDRFLGRRTPTDEAADQQQITQLRIRFPTLDPIGQLNLALAWNLLGIPAVVGAIMLAEKL